MEKKTSFIEEISSAVAGAAHILVGAIGSIARAAMPFAKPFRTAEKKFDVLKKYVKSAEINSADETAASTAAADLIGGVSASIEALISSINSEGDAISDLGITDLDLHLEELPSESKAAVMQHLEKATKELLSAALLIDVATDVDYPTAEEVEKASKAGKKAEAKKLPLNVKEIEDRLFKVL